MSPNVHMQDVPYYSYNPAEPTPAHMIYRIICRSHLDVGDHVYMHTTIQTLTRIVFQLCRSHVNVLSRMP